MADKDIKAFPLDRDKRNAARIFDKRYARKDDFDGGFSSAPPVIIRGSDVATEGGIDDGSGRGTALLMTTSTDPASSVATTTAIVDDYDGVVITTTAAGNAQTIANPTNTTAGLVFIAVNNDTSSDSIAVNGITLAAGEGAEFIWGGTAWKPTGQGKIGGVAGASPWTGGGSGTITQNATTDRVVVTQTSTSGFGFTVTRNLASGSTDSSVGRFVQSNAGDDQNALYAGNVGTDTGAHAINLLATGGRAVSALTTSATEPAGHFSNSGGGPNIELQEPTGGGTSVISFTVPALAADIDLTLPDTIGAVGDLRAVTAVAGTAITEAWGRPKYQDIVAKSAGYTLTSSDRVVVCTNTITITLPAVSGLSGRLYTIKNAGSGTVTVDGNGAETIDGDATVGLDPGEALTVICDGTEWWIRARGVVNMTEYTLRTDDVGGGVTYIGEAVAGTATSVASWRIKKMTEAVDGDVTILFADGDTNFDNEWDDRAILSYS